MGTSPSAGDVALPSRSSSPDALHPDDLFGHAGIARMLGPADARVVTGSLRSGKSACPPPASPAAQWKQSAQLVCKDVAIARLRNEPRDELRLIIDVSPRDLLVSCLPCEGKAHFYTSAHPARHTMSHNVTPSPLGSDATYELAQGR